MTRMPFKTFTLRERPDLEDEFERLAEAHVELLREYVPQLIARTAPRIQQDPARASAWPKRAPADGIIDWDTCAPYLYDWVRAQTRPYPGAFTYAGEEKVVVWSARPVELAESAPSGTIVAIRPDGPVVACGEGGLLLEDVETRAPELEVGARQEDGWVHMWVRDNGPGIPATEHDRIFDKFTRLRGTNKAGGLGIGLAFCRLAVLGHGGQIWVESESGKGATFHFTFPAATEEQLAGSAD